MSREISLIWEIPAEDIASLSVEGPMAPYTAKRKLQLGFLIAKSGMVAPIQLEQHPFLGLSARGMLRMVEWVR
jgi:hypothetical protein